MHDYHTKELKTECEKQSMVKYVNLEVCSLTQPHPAWSSAGASVRELNKANVKVKLLTGTYLLEGRKSRMNKSEKIGRCPLCNMGTETREHFLTVCEKLQDTRERYLKELISAIDIPINTSHILIKAILDPSHFIKNSKTLYKVERSTRRMCFALHIKRLQLLESLANPHQSQPQQPVQAHNLEHSAAGHPPVTPGCHVKRDELKL